MHLHADHTIWQIIAHLMIAFLFLYRCLTAIPRFDHHTATIAARGVPFANVVLPGGFALMLTGGASVALDFHATYGAGLLIVFTIAANYLYHNFWDMEGGERNRHLYTFCNNVAVMGGLVLVAAG
jgi:putative oxidoreductase